MSLEYHLRRATAKLGVRLLGASGLVSGYWNYWRGDLFDYAEEHGMHILPVHYYSPIPALKDRRSARRTNKMSGIVFDLHAGADRLNSILERHFNGITNLFRGTDGVRYDPANSAFHPLDAAALYAMICEARPARIIEIGSGVSTLVIVDAIRNCNTTSIDFTCIEPFPPNYLNPKPPYVSEIIEAPLQTVEIDRFKALKENDILFIDSTHVARYGSDVVYEILDILPQLQPGVIVHVHDIFFPDDYPEQWLSRDRFFWNEQYMLQAFLCMNPNFEIEIPVHAVKGAIGGRAKALVESTTASPPPASLWLRRTHNPA